VLIIGSGNMVHNLRMVAWDKLDGPAYGYDWALQMNQTFHCHLCESNEYRGHGVNKHARKLIEKSI
jgi:4,5-DOPA dioxygenase extradiol